MFLTGILKVDDLKESVTKNIQYFRKKMGISQEELSSLCGYSSTYIGKIERGKRSPSLDTLVRIARALQVPIDSFFDSFYRRQEKMKENWDPTEFSPYDVAMRRFNYIVGLLQISGELDSIFHLPWFQTSEMEGGDLQGEKFWKLPIFNFSNSLEKEIKLIFESSSENFMEHFSLKICEYQFDDKPVDLIFISPNGKNVKFELFYPRIVKNGEPLPIEELSFELAG